MYGFLNGGKKRLLGTGGDLLQVPNLQHFWKLFSLMLGMEVSLNIRIIEIQC